jgi:serine/threonine protein kinase
MSTAMQRFKSQGRKPNFPDLVKYNYQFIEKIGEGSYGYVCKYKDKYGKLYAIKMEPALNESYQTLTAESIILKKIDEYSKKFQIVPHYIDHGMTGTNQDRFNFLIMEYIDQGLSEIML